MSAPLKAVSSRLNDGPTVGAGLARALIDVAKARGASEAALLALAEMDGANLAERDSRIPFEAYVRLMRAAKQLTSDPAFALHFGEAVDLTQFSVLGAVGAPSGSIQDSLASLNRYSRLAVEADPPNADRFQLERRTNGVWLVDCRPSPDDFPELTESTFARIATSSRRAGIDGFVEEIHVTHPAPAYAAEYANVLKVPVTFSSGWNALRLRPEALAARMMGKASYLQEIATEHAERLLDRLETDKSLRGRLENELVALLPLGQAGVKQAAARLAISRQTLHRRLKAEGLSFENVLMELRRRLAMKYLRDQAMATEEAAHLLGFSDRASFAKAFKRWTGLTPAAVRAMAARDSGQTGSVSAPKP